MIEAISDENVLKRLMDLARSPKNSAHIIFLIYEQKLVKRYIRRKKVATISLLVLIPGPNRSAKNMNSLHVLYVAVRQWGFH